jgi:serine/threonine protein kinase
MTSVVPSATHPAIELIAKLLSVDPSQRPTAPEALRYSYLQGTEGVLTVNYSKKYLSRPPRELFDFESEKYTLEELRELIDGEVRICAAQSEMLKQQKRLGKDGNQGNDHGGLDSC